MISGVEVTSFTAPVTRSRFYWPERRGVMFSDSYLLYLTPVLLILVVVIIGASVRILREYERAVVFTLGRFQKVKGPGLVLLIPFFQEMVRVDLRIQVIEIPTQDVISRDNVSMKVDAVLYFNVVNPERAIIQVQHYLPATNMLAQTTLRAVLGQHELDEMLSERKKTQRGRAKHHRQPDRDLGDQGQQCRNQNRRANREHDTRHRQAGGSGARSPRQNHSCRGRVPGLADPRQRRQDTFEHPSRYAIALPANSDRNRRRAELHGCFSDADRHHRALP